MELKTCLLTTVNNNSKFIEIFGTKKFHVLDKNVLMLELGYSDDDLKNEIKHFIFSSRFEKVIKKHFCSKNIKNIVYLIDSWDNDVVSYLQELCREFTQYQYVFNLLHYQDEDKRKISDIDNHLNVDKVFSVKKTD